MTLLVRQGVLVADVGCDHAKLSIHLARKMQNVGTNCVRPQICTDLSDGDRPFVGDLLLDGNRPRIIASELNDAPLEKAHLAVEAAGMAGIIEVRQSDGLRAISADEADDIIIAGMGGELIARIIGDAPAFHRADKRFILQPMSRAEDLRRYLAGSGFGILREVLVRENNRAFVIIYTAWDGEVRHFTEDELYYGTHLSGDMPDEAAYLARLRCIRDDILRARSAGEHTVDE